MFTKEQKDFINNVVLPNLVNMALYDELPQDMNELNYNHFEGMENAKKWYNSLDEEGQSEVRRNIAHDFSEDEGLFNWNDMAETYFEEIDDFISKQK